MDSFEEDAALFELWKEMPFESEYEKKEKKDFYFYRIRPRITEILKRRIENGIASGSISCYNRLVLVVGYDANPALIVAGVIDAPEIVILFSKENRKILQESFMSEIKKQNPRSVLRYYEVDYNDHNGNYEAVLSLMESFPSGERVICDVTGGKKILSAYLSIIAKHLGFDICYLDSKSYIQGSPIPEPGSESLYIHNISHGGGKNLLEFSAGEDAMLLINSVDNNRHLVFNYRHRGNFLSFEKKDISDSVIETIRHELNSKYSKIDHNIRMDRGCEDELNSIVQMVHPMLIDESFDEILSQDVPVKTEIVVDPELSGIPWDIILSREYKFKTAPLIKLSRKSLRSVTINKNSNRASSRGLLIFGSGEGIDNFNEYKESFRTFAEESSMQFDIVEGENRGSIQRAILKLKYSMLIFFGHSHFDREPEKTGWVSTSGELFRANDFHSVRKVCPEIIISNSCHSAHSIPFSSHSMALQALDSGTQAFIGTRWFLETQRSFVFLSRVMKKIGEKSGNISASECYLAGLKALEDKYGRDDISLFNYTFYG